MSVHSRTKGLWSSDLLFSGNTTVRQMCCRSSGTFFGISAFRDNEWLVYLAASCSIWAADAVWELNASCWQRIFPSHRLSTREQWSHYCTDLFLCLHAAFRVHRKELYIGAFILFVLMCFTVKCMWTDVSTYFYLGLFFLSLGTFVSIRGSTAA